jgi:1,2-diacylglycerol 3-alpha-glucosyltransferase
MRIALATDIYLPQVSGVADSVELLATTLLGRGHAVRIYAPDLPGAEPDATVFRRPAWALPGSGGGLTLVSPFGMHGDLRRFAPDVVHTHSCSTLGLAAMVAARRLGVPLVGTDHTFPADYLHYVGLDCAPVRFATRKWAALYYHRCAYVTTPSRSLLSELEDYGLARPAAVVSNHVPSQIFKPLPRSAELKARLGLRCFTILLFGRIAVEKNLDFALEVFARVCGQMQAELVVVGDGPYRATLESRVRARGLASRVRMLGVLRGAPLVEAINACDISLTTSRSETQSMTMLQAMACGLPVVAARAGGLVEYVKHGSTGFLVDPGNPQAFLPPILALFHDSDLRSRMSREALASVAAFDPETITVRFEEIYRSLVGAPAVPAQTPLAEVKAGRVRSHDGARVRRSRVQ